jgi:hypothetical protein
MHVHCCTQIVSPCQPCKLRVCGGMRLPRLCCTVLPLLWLRRRRAQLVPLLLLCMPHHNRLLLRLRLLVLAVAPAAALPAPGVTAPAAGRTRQPGDGGIARCCYRGATNPRARHSTVCCVCSCREAPAARLPALRLQRQQRGLLHRARTAAGCHAAAVAAGAAVVWPSTLPPTVRQHVIAAASYSVAVCASCAVHTALHCLCSATDLR